MHRSYLQKLKEVFASEEVLGSVNHHYEDFEDVLKEAKQYGRREDFYK